MKRWSFVIVALLVIILPQLFVGSTIFARIISIAGICLVLWLSEVVPPFVPTLLLWAFIPVFLAPLDSKFAFSNVFSWAADPVLPLFFGGFALGVAAEKSGLGKRVTESAFRLSGNSYPTFLFIVIFVTAFFSMWISNIAAAALVLACLEPILSGFDENHLLRRTLLIGVALGADFGGMATPIGTGPNAIAIASISDSQPVSFVSWMAFAFPLTIGMLALCFLLLTWRVRRSDSGWKNVSSINAENEKSPNKGSSFTGFLFVMIGTVSLWLTEPFHKIPSAVIALGSAATLFLSRILSKKDLLRIDWSTLILIAGGITLGRLLEQSALIKAFSDHVPFAHFDPTLTLFLLCFTSALLSALMSNTATVVLLVPLALALIPTPSTAILVAISASFGIPFIISTPPNAMAFGYGGLKFVDLFLPGFLLMILGCAIVSLTGKAVLNLAGIP